MKKAQFKKFYTRLRLIRNSDIVGTYGYYSDLVKEFNVTMGFIHNLNDMSKKSPRLIYGKYTEKYLANAEYEANADSYYEKMIGD